MKIDVFCHIFPQNFFDRMLTISGKGAYMQKRMREIPVMVDLDLRFRMMDRFDDYAQVISLAAPPIEALGDPAQSVELGRIGNDGMAELVVKHPGPLSGLHRFAANERSRRRGAGSRARDHGTGRHWHSDLHQCERQAAG